MFKKELEILFYYVLGAVLTAIMGMLVMVYYITFGILRFLTSFKYTYKLHRLIVKMDSAIQNMIMAIPTHFGA